MGDLNWNGFSTLTAHSPLLSRKEMKLLEQSGALKGSLGAEEQLALISGCSDLREAVEGTVHIQVSRGHLPWGEAGVRGWEDLSPAPWATGRVRGG